MKETPEDLRRLQGLLDESIERAGDFLRSSFEMPELSLSAGELAEVLHGSPTVAFSTTTAKGEPRVAPVGALFYQGRFHVPTVADSARARHVRKRPSVSLTYYRGNDLAVIAHGRAEPLYRDHPDFDELDALEREHVGESVLDWGEGVYLRVEAAVLYTFARHLMGART
jgi:hypothetical protein